MSPRVWGSLITIAWLGGAGAGCRADPQAETAPAPPAAPAPLTLEGDAPGVSYRYVNPAGGLTATAAALGDVPESARGAVIVFHESAPTPAGWEQVADLSRGYPATTVPTAGFVLQPRAQAAPKAAATAPSGRRAGAHQVVMFSTRGCGYCKKARAYFEAQSVPFTEYDVERDPGAGQKLAELGKRAGAQPGSLRGVPILFVDGEAIVGWDKSRVKQLLRL